MKKLLTTIFLSIAVLYFVSSQGNSQLKDLWPVDDFLQGFGEPMLGTQIDFFPFLEKGNIALYVGENNLHPTISFKTEPIPKDYKKEFITYIWQAAIPKTSGEEKSFFSMSIDDSFFLDIKSYNEGEEYNWQYSNESIDFSFIHSTTSKENGQHFGYMILRLPVKNYTKGKAVVIKIDNKKSNPKDALSIIQNPVISSLKLIPEAAILKTKDGPRQSVRVELIHLGVPTNGNFSIEKKRIHSHQLHAGKNEFHLLFEPVETTRSFEIQVNVDGYEGVMKSVTLEPVRKFEVYFLAHSHVDIGFTHEQDEVARLQWKNLDLALDLIDSTADFPEGSQYKWNAEISWVLDGYLEQANDEKKGRFKKAVDDGKIGIDALYGSVLTGLQREEELFHNTSYSRRLAEEYGFDVRSAMITDVPGYTWGIVPGLKKMGIDYFSVGPNHMPHLPHGGAQVGQTLETWGDVPFYWVSPDKKDKLLFWMSTHGYSWFHSWSTGNISWAGGTPIINFLDELEQQNYPYDMVQLRYNIGNDNGPPDPEMPAFFKEWNEKYEWPKFKIATTMEMMTEFEKRYQDIIPEASGDFTPYWEDGAASSSTETSLNRQTADRIVQAETLTTMLEGPNNSYDDQFMKAWKGVVLFSEHTWGALQSKSDPDGAVTKKLWEVKKGYGQEAADIAKEVLRTSLGEPDGVVEKFSVINTLSWTRTELVKLPADLNIKGTRLYDENKKVVPTQLLNTGELAFVANNVPAFGSLNYILKKGNWKGENQVQVSETSLANGLLEIKFDPENGDIKSLMKAGTSTNYIASDTLGFNSYWYSGNILENLSRNHAPKFEVVEQGPVLSAIEVVTKGEGSKSIKQYVEMVSGLERVNIQNTVDKLKVVENENVRFSYAFDVPKGEVRMDIPWSVLEPGKNQLKGANLNFYSVQRFVDISNEEYGITMTTVDAPIWEIGEMSGQYWMKDLKRRPWIKTFKPSQNLFAWTMNNAWFVNYKAYQEGKILYRYSLIPHGIYSASEAKKRGMEETMPLLISYNEVSFKSVPFTLTGSNDVIITSYKSSKEGKALMLRLFNCSDNTSAINLKMEGTNLFESSPLEESKDALNGDMMLDPWEILTIKCVP
ncbi:MAG: hypothetical protein JXR07_19445 [Reichenbachiella sp.]